MGQRVELLSYGGGRQTVGLVALIREGRLPRPDHVAMVDTNREKRSTFAYLDAYVRPALADMGIPFTLIDRSRYATVDLWGGEDGDDFLPPAFTDRDSGDGKLPEFCSIEWKQRVVMRWAAEQPGWKQRGVTSWLGISWDERHRRRSPNRQWYQPAYPLLDRRWGLNVCLDAAHRAGWPEPPRSSCWFCPNMEDHEWAGLPADEFEDACRLEEAVRERDPHLYFHRSMVPLRVVKLNPQANPSLFGGGCKAGMCF